MKNDETLKNQLKKMNKDIEKKGLEKYLEEDCTEIKDLNSWFSDMKKEREHERSLEHPLTNWVNDERNKYERVRQDYVWAKKVKLRLLDLPNYSTIYVTDYVDFDEDPMKENYKGPCWVDVCIGFRNYNPLTWWKTPYHFVWVFEIVTEEVIEHDEEMDRKFGKKPEEDEGYDFQIVAPEKYLTRDSVVKYTRQFLDKMVPESSHIPIKFVDPWKDMSLYGKIKALLLRLPILNKS